MLLAAVDYENFLRNVSDLRYTDSCATNYVHFIEEEVLQRGS